MMIPCRMHVAAISITIKHQLMAETFNLLKITVQFMAGNKLNNMANVSYFSLKAAFAAYNL